MFYAERVSREEGWRRRLVRFQKCGLTVAKFCRLEGVSVPSFYQWRKRLASAGQERCKTTGGPPDAAAVREAGFLPVRVFANPVVELRLPNGVRVQVPAGDRDALRIAIEAAGRLPNVDEMSAEVTSC